MKHRGNQHDEAIDKVFAGLRNAEAPAGMEDRILRTLEARAAVHDPSGGDASGGRSFPAVWRWKPASPAYLASSAALASVLIVIAVVHSNHGPKGTPAHPQRAAARIASASPDSVGGTLRDAPRLSSARSSRVKLARSAPQSEAVSDEDALALSEMLAPSKPAPPLPLTHQEMLLAQVVHKGDPEQVADLEPEVRAKQVEIAKAEFHNFFEPAPVKDNE